MYENPWAFSTICKPDHQRVAVWRIGGDLAFGVGQRMFRVVVQAADGMSGHRIVGAHQFVIARVVSLASAVAVNHSHSGFAVDIGHFVGRDGSRHADEFDGFDGRIGVGRSGESQQRERRQDG